MWWHQMMNHGEAPNSMDIINDNDIDNVDEVDYKIQKGDNKNDNRRLY